MTYRSSTRTTVAALPAVAAALLLNLAASCGEAQDAAAPAASSPSAAQRNPLDARRAYGYLRDLCRLGPRPSGSRAMAQQQELLTKHFSELGAKVERQGFRAPNPLGGSKVRMANVIARWRPEAEERLLVCAHYDTRPLPDRDPDPRARRYGRFIGANDGGSGAAVLMELAHHAGAMDGPLGVDFVTFDGEELVYAEGRDPYFLGSTWFAMQYQKDQESSDPGGKYRWGVLLDMVGDADLEVYQERHSVQWPDTRPLVKDIWATAARLGVDEFIPRPKYEVRDDHLPLHNRAGIPTCDIIDFDYPHWHTESDTPRQCSGESLAKVGWVVLEWTRSEQTRAARAAEGAGP